jgi:hypothetical protein
MSDSRKRLLAASATSLLAVVLFSVLAARIVHWHSLGVTGAIYQRAELAGGKGDSDGGFGMFRFRPRVVMNIHHGSEARIAGLRTGDAIQTIDGIDVADMARLGELASRSRRGDVITYEAKRNGELFRFDVRLGSPFSIPTLRATLIARVAVSVVYFALGLLVFLARPDTRHATIFYLMSTLAGAMLFAAGFVSVELMGRGVLPVQSGLEAALVWAAYSLVVLLTWSLLLHFSLIFPREKSILARLSKLPTWIYVIPVLPFAAVAAGIGVTFPLASGGPSAAAGAVFVIGGLAALGVATFRRGFRAGLLDRPIFGSMAIGALFVGAFPIAASMPREARGVLFVGLLIFTVLWGVAAAAAYPMLAALAFIHSYRTSRADEKRQLRWPLWGTALALSILGVNFGVTMIAINVAGPEFFDSPAAATLPVFATTIAYLLIPVSFAFGILRYRLMDVDIIVRKTVVYAALTAVVVALYLGLAGGLGALFVKYGRIESSTVTIASTLLIALLIVPLRSRVQQLLDRRFFRGRYEYPRVVKAIAQEIARSADPPLLLGRISGLVRGALGAEFVAILELDEERALRVAASDTASGAAPPGEPRCGIGDLASGTVLEGGRARSLIVGVETAAAVPVAGQGGIAGLVAAGHKSRRGTYDPEDTEFLVTVADQLAIAFDAIRAKRQEREYENARAIQQALLPKEIPKMDGIEIAATWIPARAVGGDAYDVIPLGPGISAVTIADVAGKGMPAALLMSGLQSAARAIASADVEPSEVCRKVRRVVCSNLSGGRFVTFFYGVVDANDGAFRYTNAGHNPPILVRATGEVERLETGGAALGGLFAGTPFAVGELQLMSGDRMVLFTDGVTEAASGGEPFGEERLIALVAGNRHRSAAGIQQLVIDEVSRFTDGTPQDDVTVAVIARDGGGSSVACS